MENRAYTFVFLAILAIVCLGAYVAVSALVDSSSDPIVRLSETSVPTRATSASRSGTTVSGTRTPTPSNTPFVLVIPTIIFPTITPTPLPPTPTATLPPFPSPRPLATRTPTLTPTPIEAPSNTPTGSPSTAAVTNTPTLNPGNFPYRVDSGPKVDRSRQCQGQYYIFGYVRDNRGQGLNNVQLLVVRQFPFRKEFIANTKSGAEAGYYEFSAGTAGNEFDVNVLDASNNPLSISVHVITRDFDSGNCWYQLSWRRVN